MLKFIVNGVNISSIKVRKLKSAKSNKTLRKNPQFVSLPSVPLLCQLHALFHASERSVDSGREKFVMTVTKCLIVLFSLTICHNNTRINHTNTAFSPLSDFFCVASSSFDDPIWMLRLRRGGEAA